MEYTTPERSLAEVVQYHKLHPLRQSIDFLTQEIDSRRSVRDENLKVIQYREIELDTLIMRLGQMMQFDYHAFLTNRTRQVFEKGLSDLKREQTREQQAYWKDVIRLKEQLQQKIAEYGQAKAMLGGDAVPIQSSGDSYEVVDVVARPALPWRERIP